MTTYKDAHDWCAQVHGAGVLATVKAIGGASALRDGRRGITPCPACGDRVRGKSSRDRRGPIGMTRDAMGWCCYRCGVKGDAVTLASYLCGQAGRITREVKEACLRAGLVHPEVQVKKRDFEARSALRDYPQLCEVRAVMRRLFAVDQVPQSQVGEWLESRGLDVSLLARVGLVMALAEGTPLPMWARCKGRPWDESGHRLIAPLCDATGTMRSLHARQVDDGKSFMPKSTNPVGFELHGLALACPKARMMMAGQAEVGELVITEGLPDWLTWFQVHRRAQRNAAVIGVMSGSWTQAWADSLPSGLVVRLAGHHDDNGRKYMKHIACTLRARSIAGEIRLQHKQEVA